MPGLKQERLNIRLSAETSFLIREAAEKLGTTVSDYVTESAVQRPNQVLADQRNFVLDDETWERFTEALDRPARANQRLAALFAEPSLLDEG
jgi:uncharacterized protein (DUF1778 family)